MLDVVDVGAVALVGAEELEEEARRQSRLQHQEAAQARPAHLPPLRGRLDVLAARVVGLRVELRERPPGSVLALQLGQVLQLLWRRRHVRERRAQNHADADGSVAAFGTNFVVLP